MNLSFYYFFLGGLFQNQVCPSKQQNKIVPPQQQLTLNENNNNGTRTCNTCHTNVFLKKKNQIKHLPIIKTTKYA